MSRFEERGEGKWVPMTPLAWSRHTRIRKNFPTYESYYLWAEEVIERIVAIERIMERGKKNE